MGALQNRLAEARHHADQAARDADPVSWPHRALAAALYAVVHNTEPEQVSVNVEWPGVGMYQAIVSFTYGAHTVQVERGPIANTPYQAVVKLNMRLIRQYQAEAPGS